MSRQVQLYPWPQRASLAAPCGLRVITPSRLAHAAIGAPGEPTSLDDLIRATLASHGLRFATAIAVRLALGQAAQAVLPPDSPPGLAKSLLAALRSLMRAGADLAALAAGTGRAAAIARLGMAYRAALRQQGLVDRADAWRVAIDVGRGAPVGNGLKPGPIPVWVTGYPCLGPDEVAFLDAIAAPGSVLELQTASFDPFEEVRQVAAALAARGWRCTDGSRLDDMEVDSPVHSLGLPSLNATGGSTDAPLRTALPNLTLHAHAFPTREAEIRHVLSHIKTLLVAGVPDTAIALVARDEADYGPLVLALAWEVGVPIRALYNVPLTETRLGGWLARALQALDGGRPPETAFAVFGKSEGRGQPKTPVSKTNETGAATIFPAIATSTSLQATPPATPPSQPATADPASVPLIATWPTSDTLSGWLAHLRAFLTANHLRQAVRAWPRELLAYRVLLQTLKALDLGGASLSRSAFVAEINEVLAETLVPAVPGASGVCLYTPFSLHGTRFPHMFVLGCAEGVFPAPVADDPVFDFYERATLAATGLPLEGAVGAARRERLSFFALLEAARGDLTLTLARQHAGKGYEASDYFEGLGLALSPPPAVPVTSPEAARCAWVAHAQAVGDALTPRVRAALAVERRRESSAPPDEYDGVVGVPVPLERHIFSATQLTAIGQCPYKWFAGWGLRLRAPDKPEDELTPSQRGSLYHQTLERAIADQWGHPDPHAVMLANLERAFGEAETQLALDQLPGWPRRRREHLTLLTEAIAAPDFIAEGAVVIETERSFVGTWHGLAVSGSIDRVDQLADGAWTFVDYKTGGSRPKGVQDAQGRLKVDVQLPLYRALGGKPGVTVSRAYYYSLGKAQHIADANDGNDALAALAETVHRRLAEGDFPVAPDAKEEACAYCEHAPLCRRGPRLARKVPSVALQGD